MKKPATAPVAAAPAAHAAAAATVAPAAHAAAAPPDRRGRLVTDIRRLVVEADPGIEETIKWRGATTWSHVGLVCLANTFKDTVKAVFVRGAKLADPDGLFNSELAGNAWLGITLAEKDRLDGPAFKRLVRSSVA